MGQVIFVVAIIGVAAYQVYVRTASMSLSMLELPFIVGFLGS
jgi:hypothetical protein